MFCKPLFVSFSHALGQFYEACGNQEMALSIYETARKLAANLSLPEWTWRLLASSGHILVKLRRHDEAVSHYEPALKVLTYLASRLDAEDQAVYMSAQDAQNLGSGLLSCHRELVGTKK